jgi:hypothetical protein
MSTSRVRSGYGPAALVCLGILCVAVLWILRPPARLTVEVVDMYRVAEGDPRARFCPPKDQLMVRLRVREGLHGWIRHGRVVAAASVGVRPDIGGLVLTEQGDYINKVVPTTGIYVVDIAISLDAQSWGVGSQSFSPSDTLRYLESGDHLSVRIKVTVFTGVLADSGWVSLESWKERLEELLRE